MSDGPPESLVQKIARNGHEKLSQACLSSLLHEELVNKNEVVHVLGGYFAIILAL